MERRNIIIKWLNKVPSVKTFLIWLIFQSSGLKRLRLICYQFYFFLGNTQFFLSKSHGILKKNPTVKSIIFLLPKYVCVKNLYELSQELVLCFKELYPDILVECIYFYEDESLDDKKTYLKRIITANPSHFVYLYGPHPLTCKQMQDFLPKIDSYKIIIATDSIVMGDSYFLNIIKNDVDMIVGLDAPLRFRSRNSKLIGPIPSVISQHTFERLIQPNLSISRDIDILIAGFKYRKRLDIANYLQNNGQKVTMIGGESGNTRMSYDQYFLISCRAKIRIVTLTAYDELHVHMKGHIAEAVATASLLFVDFLYPITNFFEEGKEFIRFASMKELLEKVKWYLSNDEERIKVSMAAHRRWIEEYSGGKLWENIFSQSL